MGAYEVKISAYEVKIRAYEVKTRAYEVKSCAYEVKSWAQESRHGSLPRYLRYNLGPKIPGPRLYIKNRGKDECLRGKDPCL